MVLNILKTKSNITSEELTKKTNFSTRKIYSIYNNLKINGYIERVGGRKSGYWKILK